MCRSCRHEFPQVVPWVRGQRVEDGEGIQHLIGVTERGQTFPIARNEVDDNKFIGPVYSHDKRILFANPQTPGTMFAITGLWRPQR